MKVCYFHYFSHLQSIKSLLHAWMAYDNLFLCLGSSRWCCWHHGATRKEGGAFGWLGSSLHFHKTPVQYQCAQKIAIFNNAGGEEDPAQPSHQQCPGTDREGKGGRSFNIFDLTIILHPDPCTPGEVANDKNGSSPRNDLDWVPSSWGHVRHSKL